jgi:transcriptional regulator with XRE-family HTH domain
VVTFVMLTSQTLSHVFDTCYNHHDMNIATRSNRSIPRRIAAARKLAEMTQGQLARRLSELTEDRWSREMVANLETGRRVIPAELLAWLGVALDVDPGWFFTDPRRPGSVRTNPGSLKQLVAA